MDVLNSNIPRLRSHEFRFVAIARLMSLNQGNVNLVTRIRAACSHSRAKKETMNPKLKGVRDPSSIIPSSDIPFIDLQSGHS